MIFFSYNGLFTKGLMNVNAMNEWMNEWMNDAKFCLLFTNSTEDLLI